MSTIHNSYAPNAEWPEQLDFKPLFRVDLSLGMIEGYSMFILSCGCTNDTSLIEGSTVEFFRDSHTAVKAYIQRSLSKSPWQCTGYGFSLAEVKGNQVAIRLDFAQKLVYEIDRRHLFDDVGAGYHQLKSQIERVQKGIR